MTKYPKMHIYTSFSLQFSPYYMATKEKIHIETLQCYKLEMMENILKNLKEKYENEITIERV
jgi:uncharacterized protein YsxB (DUF464 family)